MALAVANPLAHLGRAREIAGIFTRYGFGEFAFKLGFGEVAPVENANATPAAERFVAALQELGPTFIKLGQVLSTRPDIFPEPWIVALKKLQENAKPLEQSVAREQLQASLGRDIGEVFARFDDKPLAAASIGQVHGAQLRSGEEVVVKILRPNIEKIIRADVAILGKLAELAEKALPELQAFRPTGLIAEFERAIVREVDFTREARNAQRFAQHFSERPDVVVPVIHTQYSSRTVLVMERLQGVAITDYARIGDDPKVLAKLGIDLVFTMAFVNGFFHADPHPGNIWALPGNRIGLLDMGMADMVMPETRDALIDLMFAIVSDDPEGLANAVLQIATVPDDINLKAYRRDAFAIYEDHVRGRPLKDIAMAEIVAASLDIARKHRIAIPTDITMILKALATIEGVGKMLDPDLDLVNEAKPYVLKVVNLRFGPDRIKRDVLRTGMSLYELATTMPRRVDKILHRLETGRFGVEAELDGFTRASDDLARGLDRIAAALVIVALVGGAASLRDIEVFQYRGWPIATVVGYVLAWALAAVVLIGPLVRRLGRRD